MLVGLAVFGFVGLLFAGLPANADYLHIALGGGIRPQGFALADVLAHLFNLGLGQVQSATFVALPVGLAAIYLLRRWPRAAFAAAIATTIYSSPVVLPGNFALLLAVAAPWPTAAADRGEEGGPTSALAQLRARLQRKPA